MSASGNSVARRLLRRVWPGANPLRRPTDRFEGMAFVAIVLFAVVAVVLSLSASHAAMDRNLDRVRVEQSSRHEARATVVAQIDDQRTQWSTAVVRWGKPGVESYGVTTVPPDARASTKVTVWLDRSNQLTTAPMTRGAATQGAGVTGATVLIGCAFLGLIGYGASRWWVNRQRLAAWEAEWARVGPQWRRRTG